jgi:hypothetical protein
MMVAALTLIAALASPALAQELDRERSDRALARDRSARGPMEALPRSALCVTEGALEAREGRRMSVQGAKMRAYAAVPTGPSVELKFRYAGATAEQARLGSGEMRRQFGLKLHAQDACNLVYAIWRIEPESRLVVSVKSNPAQHASRECGNRGYRNIAPRRSAAVPALAPGSTGSLRAELRDAELRVSINGTPVWEGSVGREAGELQGPVGIRSDNVSLEFELLAARSGENQPAVQAACRSEPGGTD